MALVIASLAAIGGSYTDFGSGKSAAVTLDPYNAGMQYFKAKDYRHAAAAFKAAIAKHPNDQGPYYYYALSLHYGKDIQAAKVAYLEVLTHFPSSQSATYAQTALASLDPNLLKQMTASPAMQSYSGSSGVSSSSGSSGDIIPPQSVANYTTENGHMVVDVSFNGRHGKAYFDTGAESILMGKNQLQEMGLPMPTGAPIAKSRGIDGNLQDVWGVPMDLTVGGVTRRNILVHVKEQMDQLPLLGLPFVKGMNYAVESSGIRFSAKPGATSSASSYRGSDYRTVPYTMEGRSIVVKVQINGHDIAMCLDTGAVGSLFSRAQAAAAGITVTDDAETFNAVGGGGATTARYAMINSIKLGPIEKHNLKVGVSDLSHTPFPLLGKDFWGDSNFSVDQDNHTIRFN